MTDTYRLSLDEYQRLARRFEGSGIELRAEFAGTTFGYDSRPQYRIVAYGADGHRIASVGSYAERGSRTQVTIIIDQNNLQLRQIGLQIESVTGSGPVPPGRRPEVASVDQVQAPAAPARPSPRDIPRPRVLDVPEGQRQVRTFVLSPAQARVAHRELARRGLLLDTDPNGAGLRVGGVNGERVGSVERGEVRVDEPLRNPDGTVRRHFVYEGPTLRARSGDRSGVSAGAERDGSGFTGTPVMGGRLEPTITLRLDNMESPEAFAAAVDVLSRMRGVREQRSPRVPEPRPLTGDQARIELTGREYQALATRLAREGPEDADRPGYDLTEGRTYADGTVHTVVLTDPDGHVLARGFRYSALDHDQDRVVLTFTHSDTVDREGPVHNVLSQMDLLYRMERREPRTPAREPTGEQVASAPIPQEIRLDARAFDRFSHQRLPRGYRLEYQLDARTGAYDRGNILDRGGNTVGTFTITPSDINPAARAGVTINTSDRALLAAIQPQDDQRGRRERTPS